MNKLKELIEKWIDGQRVRGIKEVHLCAIHELIDIYNAILRSENPEFINDRVKEILDKCGIESEVSGIGWRVK